MNTGHAANTDPGIIDTCTHMTGSNMFLIFRQGVKLLGGEFLRSSGNAGEPGRILNQSIAQSIALMSLNTHYTYKSTQIHGSRSQRHTVRSKQGGTDTTLMTEPNPMLDTVIGTVVLANIFCGMGTDSGIGIATSITLT